ncbi:MAG: ABC transporter permease [Blastocatellia bacterium]
MNGAVISSRVAQDVRYAFRVLLTNPGFAIAVVLSLALGIGVNTAIFSLINSLVLRTLPVKDPNQLVWFQEPTFSYPMFDQLRNSSQSFSGIFTWRSDRFYVNWDGEPESTLGLAVSGDFHSTLGVEPVFGRLLIIEDDAPNAVNGVAVISYNCWETRFQKSPSVLGKNILIEQVPFVIVGVTPKDFFGVAAGRSPDITIPINLLAQMRPAIRERMRAPAYAWLHIMGRLKVEVTIQQAEGEVKTIWPNILESLVANGVPPNQRQNYLSRSIGLAPGGAGYSPLRNEFSTTLWLLMVMVVLVLLIACANVANLELVRASVRQRELAIRLAIGAQRKHLIQLLVTESLILALLGALAGLLLANWGSKLLVELVSTSTDPIHLNLQMDWPVLAFTGGVAILAALIFGLVPAYSATRVDPNTALKETSRGAGGTTLSMRLRKSLVAAQVALSVVLLVGAGLFVRSIRNLTTIDPGFESENLLLAYFDPLAARYPADRLLDFYRQLQEVSSAVPGVSGASLSLVPPLAGDGGYWTDSTNVVGRAPQDLQNGRVYINVVSPGFFKTMGIPLMVGREFEPQDDAAAQKVVIISKSMANHYFPDSYPLEAQISLGIHPARQNLQVIGIVKDAKYQKLQEPTRSIAYVCYLQDPKLLLSSNLTMEVRAFQSPEKVAMPIRRAIQNLGENIPINFEIFSNRMSESLVKERLIATISSFFGILALLLASLGLYGTVAYAVARRTNQLGIRIALGATPAMMIWMVLKETLLVILIGCIVGVGAALAVARYASGMIYGLSATDMTTIALATGVLFVVGGIAGFIPARRAARIDPVQALRQE